MSMKLTTLTTYLRRLPVRDSVFTSLNYKSLSKRCTSRGFSATLLGAHFAPGLSVTVLPGRLQILPDTSSKPSPGMADRRLPRIIFPCEWSWISIAAVLPEPHDRSSLFSTRLFMLAVSINIHRTHRVRLLRAITAPTEERTRMPA